MSDPQVHGAPGHKNRHGMLTWILQEKLWLGKGQGVHRSIEAESEAQTFQTRQLHGLHLPVKVAAEC